MRIAVIIPFRGDSAVLAWALEGFAAQRLDDGTQLEVRLCGDGVVVPSLTRVSNPRITFQSVSSPRVGISEAKNLLLRDRPADVVIFANADTRPHSEFVQAHVRRLLSLPANSMVLGASPYEASSNPTVFDVLKEESPMIFFYRGLRGGDCCDFRHAWNLNVSVRYEDLERIRFFNSQFRPYGFEDLDLAFRLMGHSPNVYFEPAAAVVHRHPMTFDDYLQREELLGVMSPVLHAQNPVVFKQLHGTDDLDALTAQFQSWLTLDRAMHGWIYKRMQEWNSLPATALGMGNERDRLVMALYQMHVPLKRFAFRAGFLQGLQWREDGRWQERRSIGTWKKALGIQDA
ncbi:MAG TPA: glycosyltransferase family 2 protein [Phycisphaerae bacterium]|nr:glycosyltransferase family 2 protein [Phycisphaerae bacterium]